MSLTKRKGPARFIIILLVGALVAWSIYQELRADLEVGQLEYRMVTGNLDNSFEVIMLETEKQYTIIDSDFKEIFENNDAEVISRKEQISLLQKYNYLQYRVNIHLHVKNEKAQYRVNRETFNQMKFKSNIKFEIDRKVKDSIKAIIDI